MALGMGQGSEMIQPLGIVTIGGLLYSTILTLYLIPALYSLMNRDRNLLLIPFLNVSYLHNQ